MQNAQDVLNHESSQLGNKRYWKKCSRVLRADVQAPHLKFALRQLTDKVQNKLIEEFSDLGKKHLPHYAILHEFSPRFLAHTALVHCITSIHSNHNKVSRVANQIGIAIENERNLRVLRAEQPEFYKHITKRVKQQTTVERRNASICGYAKRYGFKNLNDPFPELVRVAIGLLLITTVIAATGLCVAKYVETQKGKRCLKSNYLVFTDEAVEWFARYHETHEYLDPVVLPRVEAAPDWTSFQNCNDTAELPAVPLIKNKREREFQSENADFSNVYSAINILQRTQWRVNRKVFDVAKTVLEAGWVFEGVPGNQLLRTPLKPEDIKTNETARRQWKIAARLVHDENTILKSNIIRTESILKLAEKFKEQPAIYFQYNLDFRGRTYALQNFLNPQGCDMARGLLEFTNGVQLGTDNAKRWLAIHGANCWGMDKHVFNERLEWIEQNTSMIVGCGNDPIGNKQWTEADCPFQFLAFCFEWAGVQKHGTNFVTHLPVQIDGSNNGLQILSLLSRDEITGTATNCTADANLHDIYAEVASELKTLLENDQADNEPMAAEALALGIDRKTAKRSVMTTPYGLTMFSSNMYVKEWLNEKAAELKIQIPLNHQRALSAYIGRRLWKAIQNHLGRAKSVMQWLQDCATAAMKNGLTTVQWTTPTGFVVHQNYVKFTGTTKKINRRVGNTKLSMRWNDGTTPKLAKRSMVTGIAPNFVHSLDASCLHLAVNTAHKVGLKNFMVIHDSFGTLATHIDELGAAVRFAYATTFKHDQLGIFANQLRAQGVEVPPTPEYGKLDVTEILESDYVFA